jgi:hypothetical protein
LISLTNGVFKLDYPFQLLIFFSKLLKVLNRGWVYDLVPSYPADAGAIVSLGVYQHMSETHLHRYLAEFDFRYTVRVKLSIDDVERESITYRPLKSSA